MKPCGALLERAADYAGDRADQDVGGKTKSTLPPIQWALDIEAVPLLDEVAQDQRPRQGDDADHQQGATEHRVDERVEPVFANLILDQRNDRHPPTAAGTLPSASHLTSSMLPGPL